MQSSPARATPLHVSGSDAARPGAGWEAGRRGRRGCAGLRVSMSMCLSFTPPLSAAVATAAAATAAGIAAASSLARRRSLLGQVRRDPGGTGGAGRAAGTAAVPAPCAPPGRELAWRKHVPAAVASCLSAGKPLLRLVTITFTADQCPRVKPRHSLHVAARGDTGTASGRRRATRWKVAGAHRLVRGTATCGSRQGRGWGSAREVSGLRRRAPDY